METDQFGNEAVAVMHVQDIRWTARAECVLEDAAIECNYGCLETKLTVLVAIHFFHSALPVNCVQSHLTTTTTHKKLTWAADIPQHTTCTNLIKIPEM